MVQLMPLHPQPHNFFPHLNPDWFLPFWYRLTQVVLEKRPLNGCGVVVVVVVSTYSEGHLLDDVAIRPSVSLSVPCPSKGYI